MAENYFMRAEDFDEMGDHLESIAAVLANKVEVSDWASIQKAVRMGAASEALPVGTQLIAHHDTYGELALDVVAHDHYEAANIRNAHTMTLMCRKAVTSIRFDEPEAFYYAEEELPAGTYNFTVLEQVDSIYPGTYQFTLSNSLSKGGHLRLYGGNIFSPMESWSIAAFDVPTQAIPDSYSITLGDGGVRLGTFGVELNHLARAIHGSGNYKESAVRQFLNSTAKAGNVWTPQTKYDVHPMWLDGLAGFANGLDTGLLNVVGEVKVPCMASNIYESPDSTITKGQRYTLEDKFYLPSKIEIMGVDKATIEDGSTLLPYFKGSLNADRVKELGSYRCKYCLRGSEPDIMDDLPVITENGVYDKWQGNDSFGIVPMFNIL